MCFVSDKVRMRHINGPNLKVGKVGLLVKGSRLETEGVDNVVDLGRTVLEGLVAVLSRGVSACARRVVRSSVPSCSARSRRARTDVDIRARLHGDKGAVHLEDDIVDLLAEKMVSDRDSGGPEWRTDMGKASENISSPETTSE